MASIKTVELDNATWDDFVSTHPDATPFHRNWWLDLVDRVYSARIMRLGFLHGNRLIGVAPVEIIRRGGFRIAGSPLPGIATPQQGPLIVDTSLIDDIWRVFDSTLRGLRISYIEVASPDVGSLGRLKSMGYSATEHQTMILELGSSFEEVQRSFSKNCRGAIRQAQRFGVTILDAAHSPDWSSVYYSMVEDVYERQGRTPPSPKALYDELSQRASVSANVRLLLAQHEGKSIAGAVYLIDGETAFYLDGASYSGANSLRPNNLLQFEFLRWAVEAGVTRYDMVGGNIPTIAAFKASFGAVPVRYVHAHKECSLGARIGREIYRRSVPTIRRLVVMARGAGRVRTQK